MYIMCVLYVCGVNMHIHRFNNNNISQVIKIVCDYSLTSHPLRLHWSLFDAFVKFITTHFLNLVYVIIT